MIVLDNEITVARGTEFNLIMSIKVNLRKNRWNNKEINIYVNRKLKRGGGNSVQRAHMNEMYKIRFLPTKGKVCRAIFDRKYKQFVFVFIVNGSKTISLYIICQVKFWSMWHVFVQCVHELGNSTPLFAPTFLYPPPQQKFRNILKNKLVLHVNISLLVTLNSTEPITIKRVKWGFVIYTPHF